MEHSNLNLVIGIISTVISLSINSLILYYLYTLKYDPRCSDCETNDWRHDTVFAITIYSMVMSIVNLILFLLQKKLNNFLPDILVIILAIINFVLGTLLVFTLYTYIDKQDTLDCNCVSNTPLKGIHDFLNIWRYVVVASYIFIITIPVFILISQVVLMSNGNKKK